MTYRDVLREIENYRDLILPRFREAGGQKDRWNRTDYRKMAYCITQVEDELELRKQGSIIEKDRAKLLKVRRKLENISEQQNV